MGTMQRRKGASGERELHALLSEHLGVVVRRKLGAARDGGADGLDVPGWAIEVKRCEREALGQWWAQATGQCLAGQTPVLFWRASRQPWRAMVPLWAINVESFGNSGEVAIISVPAWCQLARERMPARLAPIADEPLDCPA